MRAALILRLARTRRCAIVGFGRPGTSARPPLVDRPPSRRRVSATCASVDSAGWQQVKMRRSRSSCTGPTSSGMPGSSSPGESTAISLSSSRPRDSRRSRSIARLRAVVVIQPPGLGGRPSRRPPAQGDGERLLHRVLGDVDVAEDADQGGHRSAGLLAEDPADLGLVEPGRGVNRRARCQASELPRTGGPRSAPDARGDLRRPAERGVEILGLDDVEAAEVFLRLRERTVGGQHLAVGHAHDRGGRRVRAGGRRRPRRRSTSSPPRGRRSAA